MNTIKKVKIVVQSIREINVNQKIEIAFSGIINWEDNKFAEKIEERNTWLESYGKSKGFVYINNSKLDKVLTGVDCIWVPRETVVYKDDILGLVDKLI